MQEILDMAKSLREHRNDCYSVSQAAQEKISAIERNSKFYVLACFVFLFVMSVAYMAWNTHQIKKIEQRLIQEELLNGAAKDQADRFLEQVARAKKQQ